MRLWKLASAIDTTPKSDFNSSALLSASYDPAQDTYRVHYVSPSTRQISEYRKVGASGSWTNAVRSSHWLVSDSPVASIGYKDQVKLFYQSGGKWVVNTLNGSVWTDAVALPT